MSDSEDASATPSNAQVESTLKRIVTRTYKTNHDELTVKRVRKAVEDALDLPADWLKQHHVWATRSKELITSEVEKLDAAGDEDNDDDESEEDAPVVKKAQKKSTGAAAKVNASKKRKATAAPKVAAKAKPRKKRRVSSDEEDEESESEAVSSVGENMTPSPPAKRVASRPKVAATKARSKAVVDSDDDDEDEDEEVKVQAVKSPAKPRPQAKVVDSEDDEEDDSKEKEAPAPPVKDDGHDSESSLSSLLDEPPKKKRQKKSTPAKTSKPKSKTTSKAKPAPKRDSKDLTPDDEEIKRLQGWLLKCGIRKVWGKELKPYETPKAKIAHLKGLLADVGMTGRYSVDKARQIKEQRELAADLEAVTDFDKKWGQQEDGGRKGRAKDLGLDPSLLDDGDSDEE
jgi:hypothetical protein